MKSLTPIPGLALKSLAGRTSRRRRLFARPCSRRTAVLLLISLFSTACFSDVEDSQVRQGTDVAATESAPVEQAKAKPVAENEQSPDPPDAVTSGQKQRNPAALDLTLPQDIAVAEPATESREFEPSPVFDSKKLFRKDKQKGNVSVTVMPELAPGEELTDVPRVEGGSVDVKVKTE